MCLVNAKLTPPPRGISWAILITANLYRLESTTWLTNDQSSEMGGEGPLPH